MLQFFLAKTGAVGGGGPPPSGSFTVSPATIPANHSGNITLTIIGSGMSMVNGVTAFTGDTGLTVHSTTVGGANSATVVCSTSSGTGTANLTEHGTGSATGTVDIATAIVSVSPGSGRTDQNPRALTVTVTNGVCTQENPATILSITGGVDVTHDTPIVVDDETITVNLLTGGGSGTLAITHTPTGEADTYNVGPATLYTVTPSGTITRKVNSLINLEFQANGLTSAVITGHSTGAGSYTGTIGLDGTTQVGGVYSPTDTAGSPQTLSFTNDGGLTNPSNITLNVNPPSSGGGGRHSFRSVRRW